MGRGREGREGLVGTGGATEGREGPGGMLVGGWGAGVRVRGCVGAVRGSGPPVGVAVLRRAPAVPCEPVPASVVVPSRPRLPISPTTLPSLLMSFEWSMCAAHARRKRTDEVPPPARPNATCSAAHTSHRRAGRALRALAEKGLLGLARRQLLRRELAHVRVRDLGPQRRPRVAGQLLRRRAERLDVGHHGDHVLVLEERDGLEERKLGDAELLARVHVVRDVLHCARARAARARQVEADHGAHHITRRSLPSRAAAHSA